jgi:hypothetical protein
MTPLFMTFVVVLAAFVVLASWRYLPRREAVVVTLALPAWLAYVGALSWFGLLRDPALRPPGALYVLGPVVVFIVLLAVPSGAGLRAALAMPITLLLGTQVFRVAVELFLHRLWIDGLVPRMMTYEGANVDILVGLSAPVVAWLALRGKAKPWLLIAWNVLGLLALANVAIRAVLTAPGPLQLIHAEVPNLAVGIFPFTYIAGFFAPLAVLMHVFAIRALLARRAPPETGARLVAEAVGHE